MAIWIVRGGSRWGDAEEDFLQSESVGIYFGADGNISRMSHADLRSEIEEFYTDWLREQHKPVKESVVKRVVTLYLNQVLRFRDEIGLGDTIVMPRKAFGGHRVAHGVVVGEYEYWGSLGYRHRRRVQWTGTEAPRDHIGHAWPLSDQRTVFRIDGS